jgi:histidyl-tRNA synthetase
MTNFQTIRGMKDILPTETDCWQKIEDTLKKIATSYGYKEIRTPILEQTELFQRSIGNETDIVAKEMYTFLDRDNDSITLRPEGTAGCVRAAIQHGILYNQTQRLWYLGPMFRHERPQKGRYRQFYQFGIEAFGLYGPDIDSEIILLGSRFWQALGIANKVALQINNLGSATARETYKKDLVAYLQNYHHDLDQDSQRRLQLNPLRILDSKDQKTRHILLDAPKLINYLDTSAQEHFAGLENFLAANNISYTVNSGLVRGLDYYDLTVFEWIMEDTSGAQNAICAGGRYNHLVEKLGGKTTPAIGFALGMERLISLLSEHISSNSADCYLIADEKYTQHSLVLAEKIRNMLPNCRLMVNCGGGNFKTQFKRADKSGAKIALILGDEEINTNTLSIKWLREDKPQQTISYENLIKFLIL